MEENNVILDSFQLKNLNSELYEELHSATLRKEKSFAIFDRWKVKFETDNPEYAGTNLSFLSLNGFWEPFKTHIYF